MLSYIFGTFCKLSFKVPYVLNFQSTYWGFNMKSKIVCCVQNLIYINTGFDYVFLCLLTHLAYLRCYILCNVNIVIL